MMTITVLIPTYRRPQDLANCLEGLKKQTRQVDEILVVVRDIDTETWAFFRSFNQEDLPLRILTAIAPGQVAALNLGLEAAQGDIIAITDDDAIPHFDWLERIETHFISNPKIAGVGGRDWTYRNGKLEDNPKQNVGQIQWFGRVIPHHNLGVGEARSVDWLKGANMSYRRSTIGEHRFDERLKGKGAQGRNDLAFSVQLKKAGWILIYDPKVAVDHYPGQQFDDNRREGFNPTIYTYEVHNETLALLEYLQPLRITIYLIWAVFIGTRSRFGLVQCLRFLPQQKGLVWKKWQAALQGHQQAWQTWKNTANNLNPEKSLIGMNQSESI
ncbi:glycosyltransferase family 2 protein [Limnoraphis robusta]|uniref:Glycosyl transferase family A n=1 Tax=Limnoraphis robusta CS-951 TaxID=1637645 RepID=A0A0F5Y8H6_9CYAN|nr:glycosyltransferase family 2 protein [Limnoraphis robusta]KKD34942.1 glycosyl transferase family A [Limnoraphis robusta CS-951]